MDSKGASSRLRNLGKVILILGIILGIVNTIGLHRYNYYFFPVGLLLLIKNYQLGNIKKLTMNKVYIITLFYFFSWWSFSSHAIHFMPYNFFFTNKLEPLKIIISINTTWNIYNFRKGILEALISKGHEVIALATTDVFTANLEAMGVKCIPIKINPKGINPISDLNLLRNYYKVFKVVKPDAILNYTIKPNIYGTMAAGLLKIPTINNISGLGTVFIKSNILTSISKWLYKRALKFSNHVYFQNKADRQLFLNDNLINISKSSVIPGSGVDIKKFKSKKSKNTGKRFLFVGRLLRDKGIIEYLEVAIMLFKEHPHLEFLNRWRDRLQ